MMFAVFRSARNPVLRTVGAFAAVLTLTACQVSTTGGTGPKINTDKAVPVALLVPGGSANAGDDMLAAGLENAARLAAADLDGVKIDLRVYNTAGDAAAASAAAQKAVQDGAKIIVGPLYAHSANAAGIAVAGRGVNVLSFSNNTEIAGGNVFVLGNTFENTASRLLSYAVRQGREKVMIVRDDNVAGEVGAAAIRKAAVTTGASVVAEGSYEFSQNGVVQAVPALASSARSSGAEAIFFTADTAGALPLLTQLLPENRVDPTVTKFIGLTRWDIPPGTLELPGVQGGWFARPDVGLYDAFVGRYQAAYGEPPHPIAGLAYDGIAAIGALVKQGNSDALTTTALTQGSGFVGVNGIFRLRADGTNERGLAIAEIRNNQVVVIDPAPRSFGGAGL